MAVRKIFIAEISRTMMYVADCARTRSNRARARALERERELPFDTACATWRGGRQLERKEIIYFRFDSFFPLLERTY